MSSVAIQQWFAMGGYGVYVWSAYGMTLVVLAVNVWASCWEQRRVKKQLRQYLRNVSQSS